MSNADPNSEAGPDKGEDDELIDDLTAALEEERRQAVDTIDRPSE